MVGPLALRLDRSTVMDFTFPYSFDEIIVIYKKSSLSNKVLQCMGYA